MQAQGPLPLINRLPDLEFLEVTHPTNSRGKDTQRVIRSHVTRLQHRKRRGTLPKEQPYAASPAVSPAKDAIAAGDPSRPISAEDQASRSLFEPVDSSDDTSSTTSGLAFLNSGNPLRPANADTRRRIRSHVTKWQHRRRRMQASEASGEDGSMSEFWRRTPPSPTLQISGSERLISKGAAAIRNVILQDSGNVVGTSISKLGFDMQSVMSHYYHMAVQVHAPDFELFYGLKGICERIFLPFLFTDPALTSAIVLIAVVHRLFEMDIRHPPLELLRLKGFVITAVNTALEEPIRACSDQLLFAVANLAIYEAVFGNADVYHVHMQGLLRMLRLRGGLSSMGFDGYLEKVLMWYDTNCANIVGCEPYFGELKMLPEAMAPDVKNFTVGLSEK